MCLGGLVVGEIWRDVRSSVRPAIATGLIAIFEGTWENSVDVNGWFVYLQARPLSELEPFLDIRRFLGFRASGIK